MIRALFILAISAAPLLFQVAGGLMFPGPGTPALTAPTTPPGSPHFWYSADCITYVSSVCGVPTTGSSVAAWADRSGNGINLTQNGGTCTFLTSQINGLPAVTFASSCSFGFTAQANSTPNTWVAVAKTSSVGTIVGGTGGFPHIGNSYLWGRPGSTSAQTVLQPFSVLVGYGTASVNDGNWHQASTRYNDGCAGPGLSLAFRVDRSADTTASGPSAGCSTTSDVNAIGAGDSPFDGSIAEIIWYRSVLSAGDITAVESYLNGKYGL